MITVSDSLARAFMAGAGVKFWSLSFFIRELTDTHAVDTEVAGFIVPHEASRAPTRGGDYFYAAHMRAEVRVAGHPNMFRLSCADPDLYAEGTMGVMDHRPRPPCPGTPLGAAVTATRAPAEAPDMEILGGETWAVGGEIEAPLFSARMPAAAELAAATTAAQALTAPA